MIYVQINIYLQVIQSVEKKKSDEGNDIMSELSRAQKVNEIHYNEHSCYEKKTLIKTIRVKR